MDYTFDGKLYAIHPMEILVWDDASFPEPGMPDHIYEFGDRRDYEEVRDRIIAAAFAERVRETIGGK